MMANYGIGGMVPDVVGSIAGGLQTAQGLDYWEDRKRRIAAEDRRTSMQDQQMERQAMADFGMIAKNVDRSNPTQVKQALAWAAGRSPQMKNVVWDAMQKGPEASLNLIDMFQSKTTQDGKGLYERGKPFTNEEGERVIPVYEKSTQKMIRTEKLGREQGEKAGTGFGEQFTPEEMEQMADVLSETGKYEFTGRSMEIKNFNAKLKKLSLERQKQKGRDAVSTLYSQLDKKGMTKDIDSQQKKLGSMRSFTKNIDKQAEKIHEVANRLFKMDTKILNHPVNKIMRDYIGSADRAVLQLIVGELSEEIGKLASGATDSVAALSEGGREKWDAIYDTNLSTKDMLALVDESKELAKFRVDSMKESLAESREIRAGRKKAKPKELTYNIETGGFD